MTYQSTNINENLINLKQKAAPKFFVNFSNCAFFENRNGQQVATLPVFVQNNIKGSSVLGQTVFCCVLYKEENISDLQKTAS